MCYIVVIVSTVTGKGNFVMFVSLHVVFEIREVTDIQRHIQTYILTDTQTNWYSNARHPLQGANRIYFVWLWMQTCYDMYVFLFFFRWVLRAGVVGATSSEDFLLDSVIISQHTATVNLIRVEQQEKTNWEAYAVKVASTPCNCTAVVIKWLSANAVKLYIYAFEMSAMRCLLRLPATFDPFKGVL